MYINLISTQLLVKERMEDAMRQAERARLIRQVKGSRKPWSWLLLTIGVPKGLLALSIQLQSIRLTDSARAEKVAIDKPLGVN